MSSDEYNNNNIAGSGYAMEHTYFVCIWGRIHMNIYIIVIYAMMAARVHGVSLGDLLVGRD